MMVYEQPENSDEEDDDEQLDHGSDGYPQYPDSDEERVKRVKADVEKQLDSELNEFANDNSDEDAKAKSHEKGSKAK